MSPFVMMRIMPQPDNGSTTAARHRRVEEGRLPFAHKGNFDPDQRNQGGKSEKGLENSGLRAARCVRIHMGNRGKLNEDINVETEARRDSLFRLVCGRSRI